MDYPKQACDERHERIDARIGSVEKKVEELEKSDVAHSVNIENVCNQIGGLTKAIWAFAASVLAALGGFFIWYIQNLK